MRRFLLITALMLGFFLQSAYAESNYDAFILYPSATITDSGTTYTDVVAGNYQAAYIYVNVTVRVGTQTLSFAIQGYDPASASWIDLDSMSTTFTAVEYGLFLVAPGAALTSAGISSPGESFSVPLPKRWRLKLVATTDDDITFSIGVIPVSF